MTGAAGSFAMCRLARMRIQRRARHDSAFLAAVNRFLPRRLAGDLRQSSTKQGVRHHSGGEHAVHRPAPSEAGGTLVRPGDAT